MTDNDDKPSKPEIPNKFLPKFMQQGVCDEIWKDIGPKPISVFALPPKPLNEYCEQVRIEPTKLYLRCSVGAMMASLEEAYGRQYTFDMFDRYIVVAKKEQT